MREKRLRGLKAKSMVAPNQHRKVTRFQDIQKKKVYSGYPPNELPFDAGKSKERERHLYLLQQVIASETSSFIAHRNADIEFLLVICVALVFLVFCGFTIYQFLLTGNLVWLGSNYPALRYFWRLIDHYIFRK